MLSHPNVGVRLRAVLSLLAILLVGFALMCLHAEHAARRVDIAQTERVARLVGAELALHTSSRWLRHPTRVEPWAAGSDGPALLDLDPAGALLPPAESVVSSGLVPARIQLRKRSEVR